MSDATLINQVIAATTLSLREFLPSSFSLADASEKADQAWELQWRPHSQRKPPNGGWHWPSCRLARRDDPSRIFTAMWCRQETELCGLLLLRLNSTACRIAMVEGSPNPHHSIRGLVLLIAVELASMYAQKTGRREIWVSGPTSDMVLQHLLSDYGLELAAPKRAAVFYRREV